MKAVKNTPPIKGLDPKTMHCGNLFIDIDGNVSEWDLDAYNGYMRPNPFTKDGTLLHEKISGIKIDHKTAKLLDFKFPPTKKNQKKTGYLFIKSNHYYLWRVGEPLRLQMKAMFVTDKEASDSNQMSGTVTVITKIEHVHELQNHMRELYNGKVLDVSKLIK